MKSTADTPLSGPERASFAARGGHLTIDEVDSGCQMPMYRSGPGQGLACNKISPASLRKMNESLLGWYRENARPLPWRKRAHGAEIDPYHVWVSEIMLQQTRVETVIPYYTRFLNILPQTADLAACPEDVLLKLWEGLGYYSRVRNMQKCARVLMADYGGVFPRDEGKLRSLPGIGPYTAGAVASIAFGLPVPAVDGNVLRVVSRMAGSQANVLKPDTRRIVENALRESMPAEAPGDFNLALMDLGAMVCLPGTAAKCPDCPLLEICKAGREGRTGDIPVRIIKQKKKHQQRTVLIIRAEEEAVKKIGKKAGKKAGKKTDDCGWPAGEAEGAAAPPSESEGMDETGKGLVLLRRRPDSGLLAGMYEPPCMEGHLTQEQVMECVQAWGLKPHSIRSLPASRHVFTHLVWDMTAYEVAVDTLPELWPGALPASLPGSSPGYGQALPDEPHSTGHGMEDAALFFPARRTEAAEKYAIPSAYQAYMTYLKA